jgi:GcrA cell cycle regulator
MFDWSDETVARLKDLYKEGLSCNQIGYRIGTTRNAVIGKLHRIGLSKGRHPATPRILKPKKEPSIAQPKAPFRIRPVETEIGHPNSPYDRARIRQETKAIPIEAPPEPRGDKPTLIQLKPRDCRWPYGDPRDLESFHFCGQPRAGEGWYCAGHAKQAVAPRPAPDSSSMPKRTK